MKKYSIVFDNRCAVCNIGARTFKTLGLMDDQQGIALDSFTENEIACNVDPDRACDEMAVINLESLEVTYGYDGWVQIISEKSKILSNFLKLRLVKTTGKLLYIFFASNRRILAPLQIDNNTCKPKLKKGYRFSLLVFLSLFAVAITYKKGELLASTDWFRFLNGWKLISVTGIGWLLTGLMYRNQNKWDYWGHLSVIAGTAIFLQMLALIGYSIFPAMSWVIGSMLLSDFLMIWMHYKRINIMGMSQKYTLIWWLNLHVSAAILITIYFVS